MASLAPLYQAIAHGCQAGRHQDAITLYSRRICRNLDGQYAFYSKRALGALASDLAAISWFFREPYDVLEAGLTPEAQSWTLNEAGVGLRAQGRYSEALATLRRSAQAYEALGYLDASAGTIATLSEVRLILGEVEGAIADAHRSLQLFKIERAMNINEADNILSNFTTYADALAASGQRAKSDASFKFAEKQHKRLQPEWPLLYGVQGYRYCNLLLDKGNFAAVHDRSAQTSQWIEWAGTSIVANALESLTLSRAHHGLALRNNATRGEDAEACRTHLNAAIEGLRAAGQIDMLPPGLLAYTAFHRSLGDWDDAARSLDEVFEIADLTPMNLYLCDIALEHARLAFARIEAFAPLNGFVSDSPPKLVEPGADEVAKLKEEAKQNLAQARKLISDCRYHRRDQEVAELETVLSGRRRFTDLRPRV